jgi:hypothetical protein
MKFTDSADAKQFWLMCKAEREINNGAHYRDLVMLNYAINEAERYLDYHGWYTKESLDDLHANIEKLKAEG